MSQPETKPRTTELHGHTYEIQAYSGHPFNHCTDCDYDQVENACPIALCWPTAESLFILKLTKL